MNRKAALWLVVLVACLPLAGLARQSQQDPKPAAAPAAPVVVATDDVVARVLGEAITEKQLLNLIAQIANNQNPQLTPEQMQQKNNTFYYEALDTMIGGILLKNEGREKGMVVDRTKLEEAMKAVKANFANEEAYQKALAAQGIKDEDLRKSVEDRMLIQLVLAENNKSLPPASDAEIQKFYDENPKYFEQPEQVHAAMVFLKVNADATPEQKAEIKKKLEDIRAEIEGKKITFAEAAGKYSDDKKTSAAGGDIGLFKRGEMLDSLEKVAFTTKQGMMTPVVETRFGYHLLSVLEIKPLRTAPLDANIKANIKNYLDQKASQDATASHIKELRGKAKIEILMTGEEWSKRHAGK
jgi:peptidyl-prolyl cis-trans isomerase C